MGGSGFVVLGTWGLLKGKGLKQAGGGGEIWCKAYVEK